jgi:iron-sulfur cluster repair protein YtfE (RIC family)
MDPFELLKNDHKTVAKLFDRIESASGKAKLGLFQQIKTELDLHMHIEETIFYPALEKPQKTRDLTLEAFEEHKVVKDLLSELDAAKSVSDEWDAKLKVLRENVEHHVDEEENELFDKANDVLTNDEAERLGDRMSAEKVKRGGSAPPPEATEKPGLLQKIASTLGLGSPAPAARKAPGKKKAGKAKAAKKTGVSKAAPVARKNKASASGKARGTKSKASKKKSAKKAKAVKSTPASKKRTTKKAGKSAQSAG